MAGNKVKIFRGFRSRVFWSLTGLLLTLSVFLTGIVIYQQRKLLRNDLVSRGLSIAANLAHSSQLGLFTENSDFLKPAVDRNISLEKDVIYAVVYNAQGKVLFNSMQKGFSAVIDNELMKRLKEQHGSFWHETSYGNSHIYEFWAPVMTSQGFSAEDMFIDFDPEDTLKENPGLSGQSTPHNGKQVIGYARIGFSLGGIDARLEKIILASISITLLFLPVGFVFTYLGAEKIAKPLLELKRGVDAIEEGGTYDEIEVKSPDEIGHLAASFNMMVSSLKKKDEEIMRHVQELSAINTVAYAVNQSIDLKGMMHDALKEVIEIMGMKAGWIYLPDKDGRLFTIAAHMGVNEAFIKKIDLLLSGEGIAGKVALSGKAIILEDISGDARVSRGAVWDEGFKAFASIALCSKEKVLGVMNIGSYYSHPFTPDEAEILHSIGNLIGTAIENSMLYEKVKSQLEELENTQNKLVRTARLASLGELSANVAHEINNPLTGILTHTSMLLEDIPETDPAKKRLAIVHDETMRIRYIVRNLLDFARRAEPKMVVVPVIDIIKDTLNLVSHLAKVSNVRIVEEYTEGDSRMVSVDTAQMKQVLLNLFNNAMYAMPQGGDLKISINSEDGWVNISVGDTGCGIPAEFIDKVFDPFFTTKPETKGTGLGLSVSHGIIDKHGGRIEVESEVGKGSVFTIKLPLAS